MKLPRLQRTIPLATTGGLPTQEFQLWWQRFAEQIEQSIADITANTDAITGLAVVATTGSFADLVDEPTNVSDFTNDAGYVDTAGARAAISGGTGISYDALTGVITNTGAGGYTITTQGASYSEAATSGEVVRLITGAAVTVSLPTAVGNTAKMTFKLTVAGTMTLDPAGAETIDGGATAATSIQYTAITIVSDGANWQVI